MLPLASSHRRLYDSPIPYIYTMNSGSWKHHSTAPLAVKLFSYFSVLAVLFFLFHTVIMFSFSSEIDSGTYYVAPWTQELYFNIWIAVPIFLFVCGQSINTKPAGSLLLVLTALFGVCYLLNIGNTYEWFDIPHLQFPMSLTLLGIFSTWIIAVIKRKKTILDALKFLWLLGFVYSFIVPRFVPGGHEAGNFLLGSMFIFPFMMIFGFVIFFRKPKNADHAS